MICCYARSLRLLRIAVQKPLQFEAGAGQSGADGADGDTESAGGIGVFQPFPVYQMDALTQGFRQGRQRRFQFFIQGSRQQGVAGNVRRQGIGLRRFGVARADRASASRLTGNRRRR